MLQSHERSLDIIKSCNLKDQFTFSQVTNTYEHHLTKTGCHKDSPNAASAPSTWSGQVQMVGVVSFFHIPILITICKYASVSLIWNPSLVFYIRVTFVYCTRP